VIRTELINTYKPSLTGGEKIKQTNGAQTQTIMRPGSTCSKNAGNREHA
jgi:hypothetical protein